MESMRLAWSHARGAHEGQRRLNTLVLALVSIGGGATVLTAIALFLALEP